MAFCRVLGNSYRIMAWRQILKIALQINGLGETTNSSTEFTI